MSRREILLHDLVGRTVRDVDGRSLGRIQELHVEIELRAHGNEYVVRAFRVAIRGVRGAGGQSHGVAGVALHAQEELHDSVGADGPQRSVASAGEATHR